jgi:hypothetical protein
MKKVAFGLRVVMSAIMIFIIMKIRQFMDELPSCGCTSESLKRIKFLEIIIIGLILIGLVLKQPDDSVSIKSMNSYTIMWTIVPIAMIVYLYLIYNTYQFSNDVNKNEECKKCADKWTKYALYIQSFIYGFGAVLLFLLSGILISINLSFIKSQYALLFLIGLVFVLGLIASSFYGGSVNDLLDKVIEKSNGEEGFCGCTGKISL